MFFVTEKKLYFAQSFFVNKKFLALYFCFANVLKGLSKPLFVQAQKFDRQLEQLSLAHNCFVTVIFSAFHTYRINLSPFTKDFRVWGALTEIFLICLQTDLFGGQSTKLLSTNKRHKRKSDNCLALYVFHCLQGLMIFKDRQVSQTYQFPY